MDKIDLRVLTDFIMNKCDILREGNLVISTVDNLSIGLVAKDNIRYGYLPSDKSFRRFIFKPIRDEVVSIGDNEILVYSVKCDGGKRRSSLYMSEKIRLSNIFSRNILGMSVLRGIKSGVYLGGSYDVLLKEVIVPLKDYKELITHYKPIVIKTHLYDLGDINYVRIDEDEILRNIFHRKYGAEMDWLYLGYKKLYHNLRRFKMKEIGIGYGFIRTKEGEEPFIEVKTSFIKNDPMLYRYNVIVVPSENPKINLSLYPPYIVIDRLINRIKIVLR